MAPVKVFWVELSDKAEVTFRYKDGRRVSSGMVSAAEADRLWDQPFTDDLESKGKEHAYRLPDGREVLSKDLPPGAVWHVKHYEDVPQWCGPDGLALVVRLPNGHDWHIDGQCNNCTMPEDKVHKCWPRRGDPRAGTLHVSKDGHTCAAGAGSILSGNYHGFLHNGYLVHIP